MCGHGTDDSDQYSPFVAGAKILRARERTREGEGKFRNKDFK